MADLTTTKELFDTLKRFYDPTDADKANKPLRYVIYARKSTDDSDKQTRSLGDQMSECLEFADRHNLLLGRPAQIQEAISAKVSDKRPGFRRMIEDIKKGQYDGIIAWHPDRLARNMKDAGEIIDLLDKGTIRDLQFVSFNFDNTPSGKMSLGIQFVMSKQYSDQLSVNVSRGISHSIEDAEYINRPKHGYFKDDRQYLRPDGRNHGLIKSAFQLRRQGRTFKQIADWLNSQHYERAYVDGSHKSFNWRPQMVQRILRDPAYAGVVAYGEGHLVDLTEAYDFVPAVSVAEFFELNNLRGGNKELAKLARSYRKGDSIKADLMRGMVYCSECGEPRSAGITRKKEKGGTTNYFYYRCETPGCKLRNRSTRAKVVVDFVKAFLSKKPFSSKKAYEHYAAEMKRIEAMRAEDRRALLRTLQGKEKSLASKRERIKEFIIDEQNHEFRDGFKGDLLKAEKEHEEVQAEIKKLKTAIEAEKSAILLMPEFLEQMDKIAQIIASPKNMQELDFCIKKMFSNFSVDQKSVVSATLSEPFARLKDPKVALGAR
ncbi:MAG TPA: recombinase family protein [Candidatus Paceibacterota bacterium]|nr:recombinase family protein [Candidatus Paceibacterota bacterium]